LLEQHVDDFDLHAVKDEIAVILNWKFSSTLKTLEIYLEFIEWLRDYVVWYAQRAKSLQQRKIMLLKKSSQKRSARKIFSCKIMFQFIDREIKSFELVQSVFKNSRFLTHFDLVRQFLIDVDAFKDGFEAFVYHVRREDRTKLTAIESIVFLSKILTSAEKRYWFIELEIVVVVWVIKKLHHMIRASHHFTIIWTNHSATTVIVKQSKMTTFNTDKLNLRLVRVEMYLSQFDLDVRHKSERDHVILDALSRLSSFDEGKSSKDSNSDTLDDIDVYVETLIEMFSNFKARLISAYEIDREWSALYVMLSTLKISRSQATRRHIRKKTTDSPNITNSHDEIEFERRNNLIYHLNRATDKVRLCISRSLIKKIFCMTHDNLAHVDFHRVYVAISKTLYIRRLFHYLRQYINYCSQCLLNQIKRHKSYDSLILIFSSKISFHIITMNFVLILSSSERDKYDTVLTITNKFFKKKLLISKLNTWNAKQWDTELWKYLQLRNWELLKLIIFDRDAKFRFDLWKSLFKVVKTDLLISIVYHSQTDDQSERTNQTIEIALRYLLTSNSNLSWHEALSSLQQTLMNIITSTKYVSNKVLYEMNTRSQLVWLSEEVFENNQQLLRKIIRQKVVDVIDFANTRFKIIYDDKHKFLAFNSKDKVYLRLHRKYSLSKKSNFKLSNQRSSSYVIKRKMKNAVYELILSQNVRIHFVIFIAQLKSAKDDSDSFDRLRSINSESIDINDDISIKKSFEVKKILKKRTRKYEKINVVQYLIKWSGWEFEHNSWISEKDMRNSMKLVMKYNNRLTAISSDTT
jgi:hypothetical protein